MLVQKIKTVIFDMDGVLIDTEPIHRAAYKKHFSELGLDISEQQYASFLGGSTKNIYSKIKQDYNLQENVDDLIAKKRFFFKEMINESKDLDLISGVKKLIINLKENGVQLIVASSSAKNNINLILERFDLHKYFTHILSGEDFPQSKPHPAIFQKAHELSNHKKDECVVIEDSTNGITAAKKADLKCIAYANLSSKMQNYSLADTIVNDFNELDYSRINHFFN